MQQQPPPSFEAGATLTSGLPRLPWHDMCTACCHWQRLPCPDTRRPVRMGSPRPARSATHDDPTCPRLQARTLTALSTCLWRVAGATQSLHAPLPFQLPLAWHRALPALPFPAPTSPCPDGVSSGAHPPCANQQVFPSVNYTSPELPCVMDAATAKDGEEVCKVSGCASGPVHAGCCGAEVCRLGPPPGLGCRVLNPLINRPHPCAPHAPGPRRLTSPEPDW